MRKETFQDLRDEIEAFNLERGVLFLSGEIDESEAKRFLQNLFFACGKKKSIRIIVNSIGGDVYSGLAIYNTIKQLVREGNYIGMEVVGIAASMGAVVLQSASKRLAHRSTRFLLHEVREIKLFSEETASEAAESAEELKKLNAQLVKILSERTGKKVSEIEKVIRKRDYWLSAEEAKVFGLVDEVI
jgi:ATP-dependent Clp protease protease subunit